MPSKRKSSGRRQAAGTPLSFMTNGVIRGPITRYRTRLIAAMNLANQNRDSTPSNPEQESHLGNQNRDSTPINPEQESHLGNQNRDSTPINPEQGSHLGNQNRDSTPINEEQAQHLGNQNRDSTPINEEQASHLGNQNRDSTPINEEQASHLGNQNRDSTPINPDQASHLGNQNRDSTPINEEQAQHLGNQNRVSTPINQEQASHLGNQNRDSTPINPELPLLGTVTRAPREPVARLQPTMALTRLSKELHIMTVNPPTHCSACLLGDNLFKWKATLIGPDDSPYANGRFELRMNFPRTYPFSPPDVRFLTKIYHCNISKSMICLDVLNNQWSPALSVPKLLLSILSLLTDPNPLDSLDMRVAEEYLHDRTSHDAHAREWTSRYAMEPPQTQKK